MPGATCPQCGHAKLETDTGAGTVTCTNCFNIVESGILVTEVGFTESAGGRVHVQGAFVGHGATGVSGHRGKTTNIGSENVKTQGRLRIDMVGRRMDIEQSLINGATKLFNMAVDNRFNKGRKTDYVVASCLYLQSRLRGGSHMLIDFSEQLRINVFELGHTYIKLRSILHLVEPMPMVDPALYCLRFASRLSFEGEARDIAALASKLVRRFRTDWMTQGRRPAGVCGACLIIAARCHNFLRTPDEVGQVVRVSARTVCKRLREFAATKMADKTVSEWKSMTDQQLAEEGEAEPPIVKEQRERMEREEAKARVLQMRTEEEVDELDSSGDEDEDEGRGTGEEDGDEAVAEKNKEKGDVADEADEAEGEGEEEQEEMIPVKRKRGRPRKNPESPSASKAAKGRKAERKGKGRAKGPAPEVDKAIQDMADEYGEEQSGDADTDEEDVDLEGLEKGEFAEQLTAARDNPEEAAKENRRRRVAFMRENRAMAGTEMGMGMEVEGVLKEVDMNGDRQEKRADADGEERENDEAEKEERQDGDDADENADDEENDDPTRPRAHMKQPTFDDWDNEEAVLTYFQKHYFNDETFFFSINKHMTRERIKTWLHGRDPKVVLKELLAVDEARWQRDRGARAKPEVDFEDIDDEELEKLYKVDEDEVNVRARLWLSHNGKWLEKEKEIERLEAKAEYARSRGLDPDKPRAKRRKRGQGGAGGPGPGGAFATVREAIANVAEKKRFSTRVNYDALKGLLEGTSEFGSPASTRLERMSESYDDEKEEEDDKEEEEDLGGYAGLGLEIDGDGMEQFNFHEDE